MRTSILLIFTAALLASGVASAAEAIGTPHVVSRHGGGGHSGGGRVGPPGGTNHPGHFRSGGFRGGSRMGPAVEFGPGVPYYAGNSDLNGYGVYDDSGGDAAPPDSDSPDSDPGAYDSGQAPADSQVSPSLYYCDNPQGYYPDVMTCNDDWQPVQAAPPSQ